MFEGEGGEVGAAAEHALLGLPTQEEIDLVAALDAMETASLNEQGATWLYEEEDPPELDAETLRRLRDPSAEELAEHPTGPLLAFALDDVDATRLDDYTTVELVAAWHRLTSWAQAGAARAAAELARRRSMLVRECPPPPPRRGRRPTLSSAAAHEIAMRLTMSRAAAQHLIDVGTAIETTLAPVGDALAAGLIDLPKARAFTEGLAGAPLPVALDVQDAVLPTAPRRTARQLTADIARALISTDAPEATRRHRAAKDRRRVCHPTPLPDGMAGIWSVLPAPDAVALDLTLDAAARTAATGGDPRTLDQLRADILASIGHTALAQGWIGTGDTPAPPAGSPIPGDPTRGGPPLPATANPTEHDSAGGDAALGDTRHGDTGHGDTRNGNTAHGDTRNGDVTSDLTRPSTPPRPEGPAQQAGPSMPDPAHRTGAPTPGPAHRTGPPAPDDGAPRTGPPALHDPAQRSGPVQRRYRLGQIGGRAAQIRVTIPLAVLLPTATAAAPPHEPAADAAADAAQPTTAVAELEGYGPITPEVARAIALGGTWKRLITDPASGTITDVGRTRYTPPADLAELVRARDRTCVRPGCSADAQGCDLDHTTPYHLGGHTAHWNLGALCPPDHRLKTAGGYHVEQVAPGTFDFTLPSGHAYRREPDGTTHQLPRRPPDQAPPF